MVVPKMKEMPSNDPLFGEGRVRQDGRHIHNMYLFQVKTPAESKAPWDYYKVVQTIPGAEALADRPGRMPLGGEELILLVVRRIPPICITAPIRGATGTSGDAKLIPWNQGARCSPMVGITPPTRWPHPCLRKFKLSRR